MWAELVLRERQRSQGRIFLIHEIFCLQRFELVLLELFPHRIAHGHAGCGLHPLRIHYPTLLQKSLRPQNHAYNGLALVEATTLQAMGLNMRHQVTSVCVPSIGIVCGE